MDGYDRRDPVYFEAQQLCFDDLHLGECFLPASSTLMAETAVCFDTAFLCGSLITVDPFHLLLYSTCTSFADRMRDSIIGLLSQSCRFLRAALTNDILRPSLQVIGLQPNIHDGIVVLRSTIHTMDGELLMDGEQHYSVRRRSGAETELKKTCMVPASR